jgi:DNA-binding transcriptional ArsR family regulator
MRDLLKIFKALGDETRLRIIYLLMEREACVLEIKQAMRISQTRASRNLGILHDAGLLKARRDGPLVFYSPLTHGRSRKAATDWMPWSSRHSRWTKPPSSTASG